MQGEYRLKDFQVCTIRENTENVENTKSKFSKQGLSGYIYGLALYIVLPDITIYYI